MISPSPRENRHLKGGKCRWRQRFLRPDLGLYLPCGAVSGDWELALDILTLRSSTCPERNDLGLAWCGSRESLRTFP